MISASIPSGSTSHYVYFQGPPGLGNFSVSRSRGGAGAVPMSSPTIAQLTSQGTYSLLLDEDTTITPGQRTEMMALWISAGGWNGVNVYVEIFDPAAEVQADLARVAGGPDINASGTGGQGYGE